MNLMEGENRKGFKKIVRSNLLASSLTSLLGPMAAELSLVLSVEIAEIGYINSVFLITSAFFSLIWGIIADRTERKKLLIACTSIWATCTFLTVFANTLIILLILQIIAAIGFSGVLPISFSLIIDLTPPENRSHAFGILQMCLILGSGLGILLSGILIDFLPWWISFLIISLLGFKSVHSLTSLKEPKKGSLDGLLPQDENLSDDFAFKIKKEDFREIFRIKSNILLMMYSLLKSLSIGAITFFFVPMLQIDHGFSSTIATLIMIGSFSIMIVGSPYWGKISDAQYQKSKKGRVNVIMLILIIGPIFYGLAYYLDFAATEIIWVVLFIILILIGAFFMSGDAGIAQSIYGDINPPQLRSTVISIRFIFSRIGTGLGVILIGFFYIFYGFSYRMGFLILNFLLIMSLGFLIPLRITVISDIARFESKYKKKEK